MPISHFFFKSEAKVSGGYAVNTVSFIAHTLFGHMALPQYSRHSGTLQPRVKLKPDVLISLEEALEHLEGVKVDAAMHVLTQAQTRANLSWSQPVRIKENLIERRLLDELFIYDRQLVAHVTPRGAETLIYLHQTGELPLEAGCQPGKVSTALRIYSTKGPELAAQSVPVRAQFAHA